MYIAVMRLLFRILLLLPAIVVAGCASPGGASPAEQRAVTPGLERVIAADRAAALRAESAVAGIAVPADDFEPRGPNVTVHVARATRGWLAGKVLHPEAVDAFLADERNFFPDCTICRGVRIAFEDYGRTLRALPADAPARRWVAQLDRALSPAERTQLIAFQSSSERLAPFMQDAFAEHISSVEDPAERDALVAAIRRMDDYTDEYARTAADPRFAGQGCPLCRAAAG